MSIHCVQPPIHVREAEEYTEEEVIVDGFIYDSEGSPEFTEPPATPANASGIIRSTVGRPIYVHWQPVGNASGYKVQRRPFYNGMWTDNYIPLYEGTNTWVLDMVTSEGDPTGVTFYYRICAYNDIGNSEWTEEVEIFWEAP